MLIFSCCKRPALLVTAAFGLAFSLSAGAVPLFNIDSGILRGAQGVLVGSHYYDVEFVDGVCGDLFNGCDEAADFAFQDRNSAQLASQALLDQVFVDVGGNLFDSLPSLTAGCELDTRGLGAKCHVQTPFTWVPVDDLAFRYVNLENTGPDHIDFDSPATSIGGSPLSSLMDTRGITNVTWARWTASPAAVPEPETAGLLALAVFSVLLARRRASAGAMQPSVAASPS